MTQKKIVIIGAGIAGLSAGCYAQMNGYQSEIYEMHNLPGGLCTSWKRGPYTFDGCIDWMTGSAPDNMLYPLWQEVGAVQGITFLYEKEYCRYIARSGRTITLYLDPDRLEKELMQQSPHDALPIAEMCGLLKRMRGFVVPVDKAQELFTVLDYLRMMPGMMAKGAAYRAFFKYGKISMADFAAKFRDPDMRDMFLSIWNSALPISLFASTLAWCASGTAGYPKGGSLFLARAIEKRYLGLGGHICYNRQVQRILTQAGRAAGIELVDGSRVDADIVISAADGHQTLYGMLEGKYLQGSLRAWHEGAPLFPPYIQVSLGVNRDMRNLPRLIYRKLDAPISIAGHEADYMIVHNYSFDETLAPVGKTPLVVRFFTEYPYWAELSGDRGAYKQIKAELLQAVIAALEALCPGISGQVETADVATPATYVRYTGTWQGATMSWLPTTGNFMQNLEKTLPGLDGFYMAGQWLTPGGGLPNALKSARDAVQLVCKADKKRFVTSVPWQKETETLLAAQKH